MAQLTEQQKLCVVTLLATYHSPSEVQKKLKEEHGVEAPLQQIQFYDPTTAHGAAELAPKWRELFETTRTAYLTEEQGIRVAHRAYRLRVLDEMVHSPTLARNPKLKAALLEQAAKEAGGSYTNRRELSGPGGQPIQTQEVGPDLSNLTDEELAHLERILGKAADPGGGGGGAVPA